MSAQRLFCDYNLFSNIISLRTESPYLETYDIMDKLCDIYVEIDKQTLKELSESNPIIKYLIKRPHRNISQIDRISEKIIKPRYDDIFFLSPTASEEFSNYRNTHGILVISSITDIKIMHALCHQFRPYNLVTDKDRRRLKSHGIEIEDINSWGEVFKHIDIKPINSAVIVDNYLFHANAFIARTHSLYAILRAIVPKELEVPFHLTIFVENNNNELKKENMTKVVDEIHKLNLCKKMCVSIVAHTNKHTTHDRVILTNYHYINSGKGFSVVNNRGVSANTKGEVVSIFHNISYQLPQMTIKCTHSQVLDMLKDIYIDKKGMDSIYAFEIGDEFDNRLLMDE